MNASEIGDEISRRRWLQIMGASLAFAGLGCRWQEEEIAPLVQRPENRIPGEFQKFSTCWELNGSARPLTVTSVDGRPIKIEGNRNHPASKGGTSSFDQALILSLYDPDRRDRLISVENNQTFERTWSDFESWTKSEIESHQEEGGKGIAIVTTPSSSPTRDRLRKVLMEKLPEIRWCEVSSLSDHNWDVGSENFFGETVSTSLNLSRAKVILSLDHDLFGECENDVRHIRDWSSHRSPEKDWMNRLYVVESTYSLTGTNADHRIAMKSSEIIGLVNAVMSGLESHLDDLPRNTNREKFVAAIVDDLRKFPGQSVVSAGRSQPPEVHEAVHYLNQKLGNHGKTIELRKKHSDINTSLKELCNSLRSDHIETIFILGGNPCYQAPSSFEFDESVSHVKNLVHLSTYNDESSLQATWKLPKAHALESWGDTKSPDGTVASAQPLISPLFEGRSEIEVLSMMIGESKNGQSLVRQTFFNSDKSRNEQDWQRTIHDGFIMDSAEPGLEFSKPVIAPAPRLESRARESLEVHFQLSEQVHDGAFANNGWLQETPAALTKLTWGNAALVSPATAKKLQIEQAQVIEIRRNDKAIKIPVYIMPGQAKGTIILTLGYGRTHAGVIGGDLERDVPPVGVDVNILRNSLDEIIISEGIEITPLDQFEELATTQDHFAIDRLGLEEVAGRVEELVREGTLEEYQSHPDFATGHGHHPAYESLWEEKEYEDHAWGMAIDLTRCVGCNACMVACQSENNVPLVGKEQVLVGREMHWIRNDRYFHGDLDDPQVAHQPVACHHCENAPCEQVCPVAATVHSDEGLNDMIYNRCVGTRYCANNCPYKVRRFNFLDYNAQFSEPGNELKQLVLNPEVTVRSRGVMEKCTYCVQRIQGAKIDAKVDGRPVQDGDVVTACQEACPAEAIVFGDLNDSKSAVAKAHKNKRAYGMLEELNVKPRTKYLAKIRNPHPFFSHEQEGSSIEEHVASLTVSGGKS